MKAKLILGLVTLVLIAALVAGGALATSPDGLSSSLLARFTVPAGMYNIQDQQSQRLQLHSKESLDIAVVRATLQPGGHTGWHTHPKPSLVVVSSGSLTVSMPDPSGKLCLATEYGQGEAFVHSTDVHRFVAGSAGAEFYVLYMGPLAPLPLADFSPPAPEACS
jgi:quercetin dioxygenase-like cupin family protein